MLALALMGTLEGTFATSGPAWAKSVAAHLALLQGVASQSDSPVGPTWQWLETVFNDDSRIIAPDPSRYTLRLFPDGQAVAQADCNRASGTFVTDGTGLWTVSLPAMTRAACPPGSLGERFVSLLQQGQRYRIQGEMLIIDLPVDVGTIYLLREAGTGGSAAPPGSWLDSPLQPWNASGMALPAPDPSEPPNPDCAARARPPETSADRQLDQRDWTLSGAYQAGWGLMVVPAAASGDGQCRPISANVFVFLDGRFAGTISPVPMDARTDGMWQRVLIPAPVGGRLGLEVGFLRYSPDDALCCPSLPPVTISYAVERTPDGPIVMPTGRH